ILSARDRRTSLRLAPPGRNQKRGGRILARRSARSAGTALARYRARETDNERTQPMTTETNQTPAASAASVNPFAGLSIRPDGYFDDAVNPVADSIVKRLGECATPPAVYLALAHDDQGYFVCVYFDDDKVTQVACGDFGESDATQYVMALSVELIKR